ncbi:hypothetical protein IWW38_001004 [Coemansia aciculifera]|uniref:Uncharacterized protein n=1 Tax=Coemansia aciculifera TaxID=417176 RepID=A0ACC1M744_9FUNG|nr:hypothetical protein IWW38_001004 [Coemansia aciculifera]
MGLRHTVGVEKVVAATAKVVAWAGEAKVAAIEQQAMKGTGGSNAQLRQLIGRARRTVLDAWPLCIGASNSGRLLTACVHCEAALSCAHSRYAALLTMNNSLASVALAAVLNRWMVLAATMLGGVLIGTQNPETSLD